MPLVRIDLAEGKPSEYTATLGAVVHAALVDTLNVPRDDRFQIITEHGPDGLSMTPTYLGVDYSADLVVIQITLNQGRSVELKKAFYARVAADLNARLGLRTEDVFINLVEVTKENWSFGKGVAQYAD